MNIGIIGSGHIGGTLAKLFTRAGHHIMLSNSRGPESLRDQIAQLQNASAGTVDEAARFGEVIILATPWKSPEALPSADAVRGKIVVDAMNPYKGTAGELYDLGDSSSSEETAKRLPGARLVKGFNTIWYKHLDENGRTDLPVEERHTIFIAGDDAEAKEIVTKLIEEIGFAAADTGSLRDGKKQEPNTRIYNAPMPLREARQILATL